MAIPLRRLPSGDALRAEAEVFVNGSMESVGRRIAYFGRLLDQYGVTPPAEAGDPPAEAAPADGVEHDASGAGQPSA